MTSRTDKGKGECQTPQAREPFWRESCIGPNQTRLRPAPNGATLTRLPLPVFRSDAVGHRLVQRPHHGQLKAERQHPVNGSQREGRNRLLAKVNGVDAHVQQEAPPSPFFLADFLAEVPQSLSSHASLFFETHQLLPFREGKAALSVSMVLAGEQGVKLLHLVEAGEVAPGPGERLRGVLSRAPPGQGRLPQRFWGLRPRPNRLN